MFWVESFRWIVWTEIYFKLSQLVTNHTLSISNTSTFTDRSLQLCWMTMQLFLWLHSGQGHKNPHTTWNRRNIAGHQALSHTHPPSPLLLMLKGKVRNPSFKPCDLRLIIHTRTHKNTWWIQYQCAQEQFSQEEILSFPGKDLLVALDCPTSLLFPSEI